MFEKLIEVRIFIFDTMVNTGNSYSGEKKLKRKRLNCCLYKLTMWIEDSLNLRSEVLKVIQSYKKYVNARRNCLANLSIILYFGELNEKYKAHYFL